jgi:hypothetical protein
VPVGSTLPIKRIRWQHNTARRAATALPVLPIVLTASGGTHDDQFDGKRFTETPFP